MDSQAKYCALARGEGGILLRLPIAGQGYREKIWVRLYFYLFYFGGSFSRSCGKSTDMTAAYILDLVD